MNDTITAHAVVSANITGSVLSGTAVSLARIASPDKQERRQSTSIGSNSPTVLRVSHQPRKSDSDVQRSLCALDQTLARVDTVGNIIKFSKFSVALQTNIDSDITLAEWVAGLNLLIGTLTEGDNAVAKQIFNREQ